MFYVSDYNYNTNKWGICDTSDGVTEYYSQAEVLSMIKLGITIQGVSGDSILIYGVAPHLNKTIGDTIGTKIRSYVDTFTEESCLNIAGAGGFKRKVKACSSLEEMRDVTYQYVYPESVREVVNTVSQYSNQVKEVNVSNPQNIKNALATGVCLVIQQKTTGQLTAFLCTGSLAVIDKLYYPGFFDSLYLTKSLYDYTHKSMRARSDASESEPRKKAENMLQVFSCSLRFRRTGRYHDGETLELSSPFYSVNTEKVIMMYQLANTANLGNTLVQEFRGISDPSKYDFDFNMYSEVCDCIRTGVNKFTTVDSITKYVDYDNLTKPLVVEDVIARFKDNFEYMQFLRRSGFSAKLS